MASSSEAHSPTPADGIGVGTLLLTLLQTAIFISSGGAQLVTPLLPAIATEFQVTSAAAGILITMYSIPYGFFQLVYGPLADRFSRQRVVATSLTLFGIALILNGLAPDLAWAAAARLITGAVAAGVFPVTLAYVGDLVPYQQRQGVLGRIAVAASLGGVLTSALSGIVASVLSWRAIFLVGGLLAVIVGVALWLQPVVRARRERPPTRGILGPYRAIFQQAGIRAVALYGLVFTEGLALFGTVSYLGALLHDRDGLDYATIGILLMLNGVAGMIAARYIGRMVLRLGETGMLQLGGMMMVLSNLVAILQPALIFFSLSMILGGAGFIIAHSTLQTRATELVPSMRGTAIALFAFSLFMGGGLGAALIGVVVAQSGYTAMLLCAAVILGIFTVAAGPLLSAGRTQPTGL